MKASDSTEVSSPMILTGYAALNKLLGKNVYSSQARPWAPDQRLGMMSCRKMILATYCTHLVYHEVIK